VSNIRMNDEKDKNERTAIEKDREEKSGKRPYVRPSIVTESLMAFGAVCNGTQTGGRKDATGAPKFCNSSRLMS
jgi:hypothetical protein